MFKILGLKENIKNIAKLCRTHLELGSTGVELKNAFHTFLKKVQPSVPKKDNVSEISYLYKIVSTEVLLFREQHIGHSDQLYLHPTTEIMLEQTLYSINYLREKPNLKNLLSKRGGYLLSLCQENLHILENSIAAIERV
jgi:hypothetical protein